MLADVVLQTYCDQEMASAGRCGLCEAHCDQEMARRREKEGRRKKEEGLRKEEGRKEERKEGGGHLLKSNNPHLAGGETHNPCFSGCIEL